MSALGLKLFSLLRRIQRIAFQPHRLRIVATLVVLAAVTSSAVWALSQLRLPDIAVQAEAQAAMRDRAQVTSQNMPTEQESALAALDQIFTSTSPSNADSSGAREDLRIALLNTPPESAARRAYQRVDGNGVRLRSAPSETGGVLRRTERDAYVKFDEQFAEGDWCHVRIPEGREGWMKCEFLRPIVSIHGPRWE